ncbi:MAG: UDP-N-acetylglucosamine 4,6-dehydratase [Phycisphaerales bacterium]|nr:UDP-N-acetylglucosamine 4,6-dehydratase [Phycisphaerales bacterium]
MVRRVRDFVYRALLKALAPPEGGDALPREAIARARLAVPRRGIELADLLGRPAVNLDTPELQRFLAGKRVLVTGAGGSIGSEICRQMMRFCPERVLLVERAENNLFEIDRELRQNWVGADVRPYIADVCDARRITQIFQSEKPHVVFHCAAHKHVPMMEHNPCEAIKNNVFGTKTAADAALAAGAAAFVLISTDKAVNPSSVMGASKRFAELYVQSLNGDEGRGDAGTRGRGEGEDDCKLQIAKCKLQIDGEATPAAPQFEISNLQFAICNPPSSLPASHRPRVPASSSPRTRFLAVRFGNVLGSSGSVVPIFQKQIEAGGPVTVTHPEMKRYFMTIPEASQLVMQAGAIGKGDEIFVLDMGQPIRILDLAQELIRRNGLRPGDDILVNFTGVRPGEKLYEELSNDDEQTRPTAHEKIRVWQLPPANPQQVARGLEVLHAATQGTAHDAMKALMACVPEFRPGGKAAATSAPAESIPPLRIVPADAQAA